MLLVSNVAHELVFSLLWSPKCFNIGAARRRRSRLLWQDENLHDEYTAEYEAGAGHVVLEGRQRRGSVLLGAKGENIGEQQQPGFDGGAAI